MRAFAILLGALVGCSGSVGDGEATPARGTAGGVCYGNDTCNAGLVCVSKVCIETVTDGGGDTSTINTADSIAPTGETSSSPTFEKDIIPILNNSCGTGDNACHSRAAFHPSPDNGCRGWLSLENAPLGSKDPKSGAPTGCPDSALYDRLTKLDAWECGDPYFPMFAKRKYVEPGKPATSHLLNKMNGGPQCGVPNAMPKGTTAKASDIETITRWIQAGAPR
jgi:hypothetical protein